jgi:hypothetical protein
MVLDWVNRWAKIRLFAENNSLLFPKIKSDKLWMMNDLSLFTFTNSNFRFEKGRYNWKLLIYKSILFYSETCMWAFANDGSII